ncbi:MAG: hypothetical protein ABIY50_01475 [Ignavibacteria bacterium]
MKKYQGNVQIFSKMFSHPAGIDRGLDLAVDIAGNVVVTDYVYSNATLINDIITIYFNSSGEIVWHRTIPNLGDDKGMGIEITINPIDGEINDIFITGYLTNILTGKDYITSKYSNLGVPIWQTVFSASNWDDVATDIKLDERNAYVVGYSDQIGINYNDIMFLTYSKNNGSIDDVLIHNIPGRSEKPTSLILLNESDHQLSKTRSIVTGIIDNISFPGATSEYLTIKYDIDSNNQANVIWEKRFKNSSLPNHNIATSATTDNSGNVYVSGYVYNFDNINLSNGLDFATIKYKKNTAEYAWPKKVEYYNYSDTSSTSVDDKASSIKINSKREIFVAGTCQGALNGFSYVQYKQNING